MFARADVRLSLEIVFHQKGHCPPTLHMLNNALNMLEGVALNLAKRKQISLCSKHLSNICCITFVVIVDRNVMYMFSKHI